MIYKKIIITCMLSIFVTQTTVYGMQNDVVALECDERGQAKAVPGRFGALSHMVTQGFQAARGLPGRVGNYLSETSINQVRTILNNPRTLNVMLGLGVARFIDSPNDWSFLILSHVAQSGVSMVSWAASWATGTLPTLLLFGLLAAQAGIRIHDRGGIAWIYNLPRSGALINDASALVNEIMRRLPEYRKRALEAMFGNDIKEMVHAEIARVEAAKKIQRAFRAHAVRTWPKKQCAKSKHDVVERKESSSSSSIAASV